MHLRTKAAIHVYASETPGVRWRTLSGLEDQPHARVLPRRRGHRNPALMRSHDLLNDAQPDPRPFTLRRIERHEDALERLLVHALPVVGDGKHLAAGRVELRSQPDLASLRAADGIHRIP